MSMATSPLPHASSHRTPLRWLGVLLGVVLLSTAVARWQGWHVPRDDAAIAESLNLRFVDTPNGDVQVIEVDPTRLLATFSGEQGFLRGTLRALMRERRRQGLDALAPFTLRRHIDARLVLLDPLTSQRIDLDSFGPSNKAVFAGLFDPSLHTQAASAATSAATSDLTLGKRP